MRARTHTHTHTHTHRYVHVYTLLYVHSARECGRGNRSSLELCQVLWQSSSHPPHSPTDAASSRLQPVDESSGCYHLRRHSSGAHTLDARTHTHTHHTQVKSYPSTYSLSLSPSSPPPLPSLVFLSLPPPSHPLSEQDREPESSCGGGLEFLHSLKHFHHGNHNCYRVFSVTYNI